MKLLESSQGTVSIINPAGNAPVPFAISVDNAALNNETIKGIVTGVTFGQETNVQFMHTLRDTIYINVFGNRIGQMTLSGIIFLGDVCIAGGGKQDGGLDKFYNYFTQKNAVGNPNPVVVQIGKSITLKTFILGFNFGIADAQTSLGQFTMTLAVVPKTTV
jgi:hypothetical protein